MTDRRRIHIEAIGRLGNRYRVYLDDRELCISRVPFLAAARVLQAEGVRDDTLLEMAWRGSDTVSLRAKLGWAAKRTVMETDTRGPQIIKWKPHPRASL